MFSTFDLNMMCRSLFEYNMGRVKVIKLYIIYIHNLLPKALNDQGLYVYNP